MKAVLKTKNFKAGETENAMFTQVNEHLEVAAQRRNSKVLEAPVIITNYYLTLNLNR